MNALKWTGLALSAAGIACTGLGLLQSDSAAVLDCTGRDMQTCVPAWRVLASCGVVLSLSGLFVGACQ